MRGPDFSTVLRNSRAPQRRIKMTHAACHRIASRWGHQAGSCAARASMTIGDDNGKTAASRALVESGWPTAVDANPKISTWAKVVGSDNVFVAATGVQLKVVDAEERFLTAL